MSIMTIPREDCYEWMFFRDSHSDRIDMLVELREGVDELPATTATFRLSDVTDTSATLYPTEMLWSIGSWELPGRFASARSTRWVNPNHVHAVMYTDLTVECECGAIIARERKRREGLAGENHEPDCPQHQRNVALEELRSRRQWWMEKAAELYLTVGEAAPRAGLHPNSFQRLCDQHGFDWKAERMEGRNRAIRTWRKLHDEYNRTYPEIAQAFDAHPATLRTYASGNGRNIPDLNEQYDL